MAQLLAIILLAAIVIALIKVSSKLIIQILSVIIGLVILLLFGAHLLVGYLALMVARLFRSSHIAGWAIWLVALYLAVQWGYAGTHYLYEELTFTSLKYLGSSLLLLVALITSSAFIITKKKQPLFAFYDSISKRFFTAYFTAFVMVLFSAYFDFFATAENMQLHIQPLIGSDLYKYASLVLPYVGVTYWVFALLVLIYAIQLAIEVNKLTNNYLAQAQDKTFAEFMLLKKQALSNINALDKADVTLFFTLAAPKKETSED